MANLCIKTPSSATCVLIFQLLVLRPRPSGHFKARASSDILNDRDEVIEDDVEEDGAFVVSDSDNQVEVSTMSKLGRRNLSTGFYNHEVRERDSDIFCKYSITYHVTYHIIMMLRSCAS